jgi:hypothetical protein
VAAELKEGDPRAADVFPALRDAISVLPRRANSESVVALQDHHRRA